MDTDFTCRKRTHGTQRPGNDSAISRGERMRDGFASRRGRSATFLYDELDRRTYTILADGSWTLTTYDAIGRRIAETDQSTNTTWFAYDALGRLIGVTNALGKVTSYAYDELGSLVAQTDANNH